MCQALWAEASDPEMIAKALDAEVADAMHAQAAADDASGDRPPDRVRPRRQRVPARTSEGEPTDEGPVAL